MSNFSPPPELSKSCFAAAEDNQSVNGKVSPLNPTLLLILTVSGEYNHLVKEF